MHLPPLFRMRLLLPPLLLLATAPRAADGLLPTPLTRARYKGRFFGVAVQTDIQLETRDLTVAHITMRGLPLRLRGGRVDGWARQRRGAYPVLAPALEADLERLDVALDVSSIVFVHEAMLMRVRLPVFGWKQLCLQQVVTVGERGTPPWWETGSATSTRGAQRRDASGLEL